MTSTARRWIIGRGLLGRAVSRSRADTPFAVDVSWDDPERAIRELTAGAEAFLRVPGPVEIYWCAGKGVTSTPRESLFAEVALFGAFLDVLARSPLATADRLVLFLASSVGGAYGGAVEPPHRESTPPASASAYGDAKLAMETLAAERGAEQGWRTVIGRLTNLYGPGQDLTKKQGLISTLVDSAITMQPAIIYVSLDTLRDYIFEDDAAAVVSAAASRARLLPAGATVVKIVGTGRAVSVGAILGELRRLRRRSGFSLLGQGPATGQALDLRVRSEVWTDLDALVATTLPEGLDRVLRARLAMLGRP
ncbi:NAD-dependent epimerase/dehydratase family protein [uncultured Microbacterium sp.]|uniref:NAD-dependent epimerase/dehydratase family protein n=1 Tax=Microbacterium algeriense TaxID=2615184 RepID=UPI0025997CF4|nr:NAD-dependent epimerase/dehydratase family protein [uncultured Microbacterium sp.]